MNIFLKNFFSNKISKYHEVSDYYGIFFFVIIRQGDKRRPFQNEFLDP